MSPVTIFLHLHRNLTYNGTLRKNKPYLLTCFLPALRREVHSSIFGFQAETTIVSCISKKGKSVILISTLHKTGEITNIERKPQMILDYNSCKGGVDTLDQLVRTYSCKRKTNRWPFALFVTFWTSAHTMH